MRGARSPEPLRTAELYTTVHPRGKPSRPSLHPGPALGPTQVISPCRDPPLAGGRHGPRLVSCAKCPPTRLSAIVPPGAGKVSHANTRSSPEQGGQESRDQLKDPLGSCGHWALGRKAKPWRPTWAREPPGPGPRHTESPISTLGKTSDGPTFQTKRPRLKAT